MDTLIADSAAERSIGLLSSPVPKRKKDARAP